MVEYVEKEQAINIVDKILQNNKFLLLGERMNLNIVKDNISSIPAADVQTVKQGRWLHIGDNVYQCQLCGYKVKLDYVYNPIVPNFCGSCGAYMRELTK